MTRLDLDGGKMATIDDFHDQVARHSQTPNYYGRNLDAFFDVVAQDFEAPILVLWRHSEIAKTRLGCQFDKVGEALLDAQTERKSMGQWFDVIYE